MRAKLQLPEYGRHIQQMVDMLKGIEDRSERNRQAQAVIAVMGNLNPLLRDTADYTHKLWDHLYIMSNFEIDVDSPYPSPSRETLNVKPERLDYSNSRAIRHKHYGKYVSRMLQSLSRCEDREAVAQVVDNIAVYMRAKSFEYNEEHPNNEVILKDLRVLSENAIFIDESAINNIQSDYKSGQTTQSKRLQKSQKMMKGGRNVHQNGSKGGGVDGRSAHNKGRSGQQNRNFVKNNSQRRGQNQ
ncbi:MAG: DUF4290 domain-containing protein [Rikenellaceae bacterium]